VHETVDHGVPGIGHFLKLAIFRVKSIVRGGPLDRSHAKRFRCEQRNHRGPGHGAVAGKRCAPGARGMAEKRMSARGFA